VKRLLLLFLAVALLYVAPGFLPGRRFAPLDIPATLGAWNPDAAHRVRPANSLLTDVVAQFVPWDHEIRRLAANGEFPWTNRYAADGAPLFANLQTALFSPFTWPRLLFGLEGWAIMALLKLLAAALCAYWFARELDVLPRHAVVSALGFADAGDETEAAVRVHGGAIVARADGRGAAHAVAASGQKTARRKAGR